MEKALVAQEIANSSKAYKFSTVDEVMSITNGDIKDLFYIGDKIGGNNYRSDFSFKTPKEVAELQKNYKKNITSTNKEANLFVYNERTEEVVPFKEKDYLMYDAGYVTIDGDQYIACDDNGNEISRFPCQN